MYVVCIHGSTLCACSTILFDKHIKSPSERDLHKLMSECRSMKLGRGCMKVDVQLQSHRWHV